MDGKKIRKAILPVGGFGTRFLPATKAQPKEMLPIVDKPVVQYLVEEAVAAGIEQIIFVTGKGKRAIEDHFDSHPELEYMLEKKGKNNSLDEVKRISNMAEFFFVRQQYARGNGDAVLCAKSFIGDEPCAVLFGDDLVDSEKIPAIGQLISVYERYRSPVIGITNVAHQEVSKYGIVEGVEVASRLTEIQTFVEKPKPSQTQSTKAVIGKYIITPDIFEELQKMKECVAGELGLDHAFNAMLGKSPIYGYEIQGKRYDCGDKLGYVEATVEYALKHPVIGSEFREYLKNMQF
jgi:UTP--glucose-1-phosphate uridylyltransferase